MYCTRECKEASYRANGRAREYNRKSYQKNRDKVLARSEARRIADPEAARAKGRRYWKRHPELLRLAAHRRRGDKDAPRYTPEEWAAVPFSDLCSYCGGKANTVDHVVPLSAGGSLDIHNVVPACRRCNAAKRDRSLIWFLFIRSSHDTLSQAA